MTDRRRALIVDAFAEEPLAGNPAGVVPEAAGLAPDQMQAIARELNASETVFLFPSGGAGRSVRYFTPETEVDLCGHATIAAFHHLHADDAIEPGTHGLETEVGVLDIEVESDGTVWMTQDAPEVREVDVDPERVAAALGVEPVDLLEELPLARASTGMPYLVVPMEFLQHLGGAEPDQAAIETLAEEVDAVGIYAFTFDTLDGESTLHGRMFAPGAGIAEDPGTGTASGAVGAYVQYAEAFDEMPDELVCEQGHYVDRPGRVRVRVGTEVQVGGTAVTALDGHMSVPPAEDDEIIEA